MKKTLLLFLILTNALHAQINKLDVVVKDGDAIKTHYLPKYVLDTLKLPAGSLKISGIDVLNIYVESPPVVIDSTKLGKTLLAVNYTRYADVGGVDWNDVQIPSTGEIGKLSELTNTEGSKSHILFISHPVVKVEMSNSTNDEATTPSTFPAAVKKRGLTIIGHDTLGQSISGFEPFKKYHLSLFIRSSFGPDIFRIMAADTLDFKGATANTTRSYEIPVQADENGIVHFYLTSMDKSYNHPQLSINAFYVREYNPYYPFQGDDISDIKPSTGSNSKGIDLPVIQDYQKYKRSDRIIDKSNIRYVFDQYGGFQVAFPDGKEPSLSNMYLHDGYSMLDLDQYVIDGTRVIGVVPDHYQKGHALDYGSKVGFQYEWLVGLEMIKPVQLDSIGMPDIGTFSPNGNWDSKWITLYGESKWGDRIVLVDSIEGTGTGKIKWYKIDCADTLKWIWAGRNKIDINDRSGNQQFRTPISLILIGDKSPFGKPVPKYKFKPYGISYYEGIGVNNVINSDWDTVNHHYGGFNRMYNNLRNYKPGGVFAKMMLEPYNGQPTKAPELPNVDDQGRPIYIFSEYLSDQLGRQKRGLRYPFEHQKKIILLLQMNWNNYLNYDQNTMSPTVYIADTTEGTYWRHGGYFERKYERSPSYDFREEIYQAANDKTYYPVKDDSKALANWVGGKYGYTNDSTYFHPKAFESGFALTDPRMYKHYGKPDVRNTMMIADSVYLEYAKAAAAFSALYGRNVHVSREDIEQYIQADAQMYEVGTDCIDALAFTQEFPKTFRYNVGHKKDRWVGRFWNYIYDGFLGTMKTETGSHFLGMWTADTTMMLSAGGDVLLSGINVISAYRWMMKDRFEVWDTLKSHKHPYNGYEMRLYPKMHFDPHHYSTTNGGQGDDYDIYAPGIAFTRAMAPEKENHAALDYFMEFVHSDEVASDCEWSLSEFGFNKQSGGPTTAAREDIGIIKKEYRHLSKEEQSEIPSAELYTWARAADRGARGADSVDMCQSMYQVSLTRRQEIVLMLHGFKHMELFMFREPSARPLLDEEKVWRFSGGANERFAYCGHFGYAKSSKTNLTNSAYMFTNTSDLMHDYELMEADTTSERWIVTWRNTKDHSQFIKQLYRPTLQNDTTYGVKIEFDKQAYSVEKINPWVTKYGCVVDQLGDVAAIKQNATEAISYYRYRVRND